MQAQEANWEDCQAELKIFQVSETRYQRAEIAEKREDTFQFASKQVQVKRHYGEMFLLTVEPVGVTVNRKSFSSLQQQNKLQKLFLIRLQMSDVNGELFITPCMGNTVFALS